MKASPVSHYLNTDEPFVCFEDNIYKYSLY